MADENVLEILARLDADVKGYMAKMDSAAKSTEKSGAESVSAYKKVGEAISNAAERAVQFGEKALHMGKELLVGFGAFEAVKGIIEGAVIKSMSEFEDSMVRLGWSVGGTSEEMEGLKDGLLALSKETGKNATDLASLATLAVQLGVKGTAGILAFTKTAVELKDVAGLSEQGTAALTRFILAMGGTTDDVQKFGSALTALHQETGVASDRIVEMSANMMPFAKASNMSIDAVMGMAAAFGKVGGDSQTFDMLITRLTANTQKAGDEAGKAGAKFGKEQQGLAAKIQQATTEIGRIEQAMTASGKTTIAQTQHIQDLQLKVGQYQQELAKLAPTQGKNTESMDAFARVVGLSDQAWTALIRKDPAGAMKKLGDALATMEVKAKASGETDETLASKIAAMTDGNVRFASGLLKVIPALQQATGLTKDASDAASKNALLTKEAGELWNSFGAVLERLWQSVKSVWLQLYEVVLPPLADFITRTIMPAIDGLFVEVGKHKDDIKIYIADRVADATQLFKDMFNWVKDHKGDIIDVVHDIGFALDVLAHTVKDVLKDLTAIAFLLVTKLPPWLGHALMGSGAGSAGQLGPGSNRNISVPAWGTSGPMGANSLIPSSGRGIGAGAVAISNSASNYNNSRDTFNVSFASLAGATPGAVDAFMQTVARTKRRRSGV